MTQKQKLLTLLVKEYNGVTSQQASRRGIKRVPARVHELRTDGWKIYTNYRRNKRTGKKEYSFRLDNIDRDYVGKGIFTI